MYFYLFVCGQKKDVGMCVDVGGQFSGMVLSCHHVNPKDQTQVAMFAFICQTISEVQGKILSIQMHL